MADADAGPVAIDRLDRCGMIALRGDLGAEWVPDLLSVSGFAAPEVRCVAATDAGLAIWFSPDELLLMCDPDRTATIVQDMTAACREAQVHALVTDVSDARARFAIAGSAARATLAKLCPVDLAPGRFEPGEIRRTRLAQVACAFWMTGPAAFELICFRSVADYVLAALQNAGHASEGVSL